MINLDDTFYHEIKVVNSNTNLQGLVDRSVFID